MEMPESTRKALEKADKVLGRSSADQESAIVKVRFVNHTTGEPEGREYSYYTEEPLGLGFNVKAPTRNGFNEAKVTAVDVPESEIAAFRDKVKVIPAGSVMVRPAPDVEPFPGQILTNWSCSNCGTEFPAAKGPEARCPTCGTILKYGPPFGTWEGDKFKPDNIQGRLVVDEEASKEAGTLVGDLVMNKESENLGEAASPTFQAAMRDESPGPGNQAALVAVHKLHEAGQVVEPGLFNAANEAVRLRDIAAARIISTNEDLKPATDDLAIIVKVKKAVQEHKTKILAPFKSQVEAINAAFNLIVQPLEEADQLTRGKVNEFRALEEAKLALARREAAAKGGEHTVELQPPVPEHTRTDLGTLGQRSNWKARIVDFAKLPDEYKLPNEQLLNAYARTHKGQGSIPGVEFYDERNVVIRTK